MLDVCFGASECGMLKYALRKSNYGVTYSFCGLEFGKISNENFIESRKKWIDFAFAICSPKERVKILKEDIARFDEIIATAKKGETLRIWCATTPCAKSGFYHLIYNLQGIDCPILVVDLPADFSSYRSGDESVDHSWGEVEPEMMEKGIFLQRELLREERDTIASKWAKLVEENADLRLNVDGELTSVPIDYMDKEIMDAAPLEEFKMVTLIGFILAHSRHGVSDSFIAERIEALIEKNDLTIIKRAKKREDYYRDTILKRTKEFDYNSLNLTEIVSLEPDDM